MLPAAVALVALGLPAHASAEVLLDAIDDPDGATRAPTLIAPDGTRRPLARPGGRTTDLYQFPAVSPDRSLVARTLGRRLVLVPTDGGPRRILGPRGLRAPAQDPQSDADPGLGDPDSGSFYSVFGTVGPSVWWDTDGSHVRRDALRTAAGTPAVLTCAVATGRCGLRPSPRGLERIAARTDGSSLWSGDTPPEVDRYVSSGPLVPGDRVRATPAAVRRVRKVLREPHADALVLVAPGGAERTLWSSRRSYAAGVTSFNASEGGPGGTIITWTRSRYVLQTRRRNGRPQGRLRIRTVAEGSWRISPSGRRSTFRVHPAAGDRLDSVTAPAGPHGWYGSVRTRRGRYVTVTVDDAGAVRPVLLDGQALTGRRLRASFGLPTPASDTAPELAASQDLVGISGYEAATDSLIASVYTGGTEEVHQVVARVPLAGGPPSLLSPFPNPAVGGAALSVVTAW